MKFRDINRHDEANREEMTGLHSSIHTRITIRELGKPDNRVALSHPRLHARGEITPTTL